MVSSNSDFAPASAGHGRYAPFPVPSGSGVVRVPAGTPLQRVFVFPDMCPDDVPAALVLEQEAQADLVFVVLPGSSARIPLTVDLAGPEAQVRLRGLFLSDGEDEVRITVTVHHRHPHCQSRQLFNGILAGKARGSFHGTVIVAPDAQGTEAYQENHTIILGEAARMETQPVLEIYADDVKCSHGATVGALDENEHFYMRSRGIPEAEARVLQILSFLSPVLDAIPDEEQRAALTARVEEAALRCTGL